METNKVEIKQSFVKRFFTSLWRKKWWILFFVILIALIILLGITNNVK